MSDRLRRSALAVLLFVLFASAVPASAAVCTGVANYNASTIYNPGDKAVHAGHLWHANIQIWNTPPDYCPSCGWWTDEGACSGTTDTTAPSVPTGLNSPSKTTTSISLAWTASTDNAGGSGILNYDILRGGTVVGTSTTTSFTNTGLTANTTYSYTVRARDVANNVSAASSALSVTTNANTTCAAAPSVPTGLSSPSKTSTSVNLSWSASTAGAGCTITYQVRQNGTTVQTVSGTTATVTGLTPSTAYTFTIVAVDSFGSSAPSSGLSVTTNASGCTVIPTVPTGLASPSQTTSSVNLTWNASTAGANCTITYRVLRGGTLETTVSGTSATINGLAANTTYQFSLQATDEAGTSNTSGTISATTKPITGGGNKVGAYFVQWGVYQRAYYAKHIDTSGSAAKLNFVNYAFNNVVNNKCEVGVTQAGRGDAMADYGRIFPADQSVDGVGDTSAQKLAGNWNQLKKLKAKYPNLKILISLGGWTWSDGFYSAARPENRVAFVKSCIDAYIKGDLPVFTADSGGQVGGPGVAAGIFDGIDLDWEYLGVCGNNPSCGASAADKANFTALVTEFRNQLNAVRSGLLLTAAVAAGEDKIPQYDIPGIASKFDWINIMSYDFFGAWAAAGPTAFHSPLFAWTGMPSTPPQNHYYTDFAVQMWKSGGMAANKLLIGIGFYGRGWGGVTNANNGLNQPAQFAATGTYEAGIEDYDVLKTRGFPAFTSTQAGTAWIFNGNTFWSYDTPGTISTKMSYVKSQGLAGAFAWSLDGDDGTLVSAMRQGLP